ncbi:MAG TPA: hypothetical protein VJR67_03055 [Candidatus Nitrosopolaris sp.]|nr:hypothetical protein [Candidatus Nitrosopolaris sp.]
MSKNQDKNKKKRQVVKEKSNDNQHSEKYNETPGLQDYRTREE